MNFVMFLLFNHLIKDTLYGYKDRRVKNFDSCCFCDYLNRIEH